VTGSLIAAIAQASRTECAAVLALVGARLVELEAARPVHEDELLDVRQAARLIGISPLTLSHKRKVPPYAALVVPTGSRVVRYSRARIEAWKASSAGSPDASPAGSPRERKRASLPARSQPDWLASGRGRSL
jgi:predicted DNA-binding transcriptional regulator AlpA